MEGEIITIGDEIISGRVCDLNAHYLSGRLSASGLAVKAVSTVGDDPDKIREVLGRAVERSDFVLVCGGLGPTEDDITTAVVADFFSRPLVLDRSFLEYIKGSLQEQGVAWVESYEKLAFIPEGATLIDPGGRACGYYLYHSQVPVLFLPGIPEEVRFLAETKVLPFLLARDRGRDWVRQRLLKVFGLSEAQIGELLRDATGREQGVLLGYYPNFPENHVTITVRARSEEEAAEVLARVEAEVEERLGAYLVAKDETTLEESVGRLLRARGLSVAVAESCTGGLIGHRLTSVPGSSDYFDRSLVVYSNRSKMEMLGVSAEVLEKHGAVSAETAVQMAEGVARISGASLCLAATGIAGPTGGTAAKPVGTVFIALAAPGGVKVERFQFWGRRDQIKMLTAQTALDWLHRYLLYDSLFFRH